MVFLETHHHRRLFCQTELRILDPSIRWAAHWNSLLSPGSIRVRDVVRGSLMMMMMMMMMMRRRRRRRRRSVKPDHEDEKHEHDDNTVSTNNYDERKGVRSRLAHRSQIFRRNNVTKVVLLPKRDSYSHTYILWRRTCTCVHLFWA